MMSPIEVIGLVLSVFPMHELSHLFIGLINKNVRLVGTGLLKARVWFLELIVVPKQLTFSIAVAPLILVPLVYLPLAFFDIYLYIIINIINIIGSAQDIYMLINKNTQNNKSYPFIGVLYDFDNKKLMWGRI